MIPVFDRAKAGLAAFVAAVFPRVDYLALYPATIVQQRGPNSFDVQPDNPSIPGMSGIPIWLPFPGMAVTLNAGQKPRCLVGFAEGDPTKPYVSLWAQPGAQALTIAATTVNLGSTSPADAVALASQVLSRLQAIVTAFNSHTHTSAAAGSPTSPPVVAMGSPSSVASTVVLSS